MNGSSPSATSRPSLHFSDIKNHPDYVDLSTYQNVLVDLKYATADNFLNKRVYNDVDRALAHRKAAEKFRRATELLQVKAPGFRFRIYDALRPRSAQWELWKVVVGTAQEKYVANPERGSVHNFGFALDLTLDGPNGEPLDMGTGFDAFVDESQPRYEDQFYSEGKLSDTHMKNRELLRFVMVGAGFIQLPHEWWHFDALPPPEVRANYTIIE